jgi:cytochrome c oxidase subunit 2
MNLTILATELSGKTYWLPEQVSDVAAKVDHHFYLLYWLCVGLFIGITGALVLFVVKYRRRTPDQEPLPSPSHNAVLELTWSIIPSIVCLVLFYIGFVTYQELMTPPRETFKVNVIGGKWQWEFQYPKTGLVGASDDKAALAELHVPPNVPVELTMTSKDVIHCVYIPALRTKKDVVPGRYSKLWFDAKVPGVYNIFCAEYCGTSHSEMYAKLIVHKSMEEFEQWEKNLIAAIQRKPPLELGEYVWKTKGCRGCHSIDGTVGTGPSFLGIWGDPNHRGYIPSTGADNQPITVDENYIRTSIEEPNSVVREGFGRVTAMPTFKGRLSDKEMNGIIEFIKSLGKKPAEARPKQ